MRKTMEHLSVLQNGILVIFHQQLTVVLQHLLQLYLQIRIVQLTHAVGKEKLQSHAIALELVTAAVIELCALGMPAMHHVKH